MTIVTTFKMKCQTSQVPFFHLLLFLSYFILVSSLRPPNELTNVTRFEFTKISKVNLTDPRLVASVFNVTVEELEEEILEKKEKEVKLDPDSEPPGDVSSLVSSISSAWSRTVQEFHDPSSSSENKLPELSVERKWILASQKINNILNSAIKSSLPLLLDLFSSNTLSPKCTKSLLHILQGVRANQESSLAFIDSSGRIPAGVMTGTLINLGDYDQCRGIRVTEDSAFNQQNEREEEETQNEEIMNDGEKKEDREKKQHDLIYDPEMKHVNHSNLTKVQDQQQVAEEVEEKKSKEEEKKKKSKEEITKTRIKNNIDEEDVELFRGQYCLLRVKPVLPVPDKSISLKDTIVNVTGTPLQGTIYEKVAELSDGFYSLPFQFAICIPSTCLPGEIEPVIKKLLEPIYFSTQLGPICDIEDDTKYAINGTQKFAIIVTTLIVMLVLICTILDHMLNQCGLNRREISQDSSQNNVSKQDQSIIFVLCDSFSISKNLSKLFNLETESEPKLHFIHGIRVLTMIWVIICHTYTFGTQFLNAIGSVRIEHEILPLSRTFSMQLILNGWFSVETFFFLSGVIVVYVGMPLVEKSKGKLSLINFILLRWIRFTPALAGIILIHFIWPLLGSGPVFLERSQELLEPCYSNWWKNFLYINNWVSHPDHICLKHTWYLSADFQFHVVAYFVLQLFYWFKNYAIAFNCLMMLAGMIVPAVLVYVNDLPPTLIINTPFIEKFEGYFSHFYFPTYNHITPYFMGLLIGYVVIKSNVIYVSKSWKMVLWTMLPVTSLCMLFSTYLWNGLQLDPDPIWSSVYAGTHRFIWIAAIAWISLSSSFKIAGIVGRFLCSKFWIPFSRLSYQVYLVHFVVIYYHFLTQRSGVRFTHYDRLFMSCGILIYSLIFSFFTYLIFEAPFAAFIKHTIIDSMKKKDEETETNSNSLNMNVVYVDTRN